MATEKISTSIIADDAVTNAKIGADAVSTTEIANDASISTSGNITTTGSGTLTVAGASTFSGGIANAGTITAGTIGSSVTGFGLITGVDTWSLTADKTTSATITSDLERVSDDNAEYGSIGTAMTESSGVFTFPSTGIWMVQAIHSGRSSSGAVLHFGINVEYTSDGTNFNLRARTINGSGQTGYCHYSYGYSDCSDWNRTRRPNCFRDRAGIDCSRSGAKEYTVI